MLEGSEVGELDGSEVGELDGSEVGELESSEAESDLSMLLLEQAKKGRTKERKIMRYSCAGFNNVDVF